MNITIYHNPRCSKSREALGLLEEQGVHVKVMEYLKQPLSLAELRSLRQHFSFDSFVRSNEHLFKELQLNMEDEDAVLQAMSEHPKLMQRPIVVAGDKAMIGRPPEKILELL